MKLRRVAEFFAPNEHIILNRDDLYVPSEIHEHEFVELEYILAGKGTQFVNGKEYQVKRGDVISLEVGSNHSYHSNEKLVILNCIIHPLFFQQKKAEIQSMQTSTAPLFPDFMTLSNKHFAETENLLFSMEQEFKQKQPCYQQMLDNYASTLLIILFRNAQEQVTRHDSQLQKRFMEYVDKNFAYCTLQSTALFFGYSTSHFSRLFKQVMEQNFSDYVNHRRLEAAIELLNNTAFSIDTISHQLGYKDRSQFHKLFLKHMNMTPAQYRKQNSRLKKAEL